MRPLLFRLDAERAHDLAMRASELGGRSGLTRRIAHRAFAVRDPRLRTTVAGLAFANPLGLAAGFDKNGRAAPMLGALGFGHVEIGSVSAHPSDGNPRPRLFRIPEDRGIVVAYGVPNEGADAVAARLAGSTVRARARRQPRQDQRPRAAGRGARRLRGLRRLARPAAGPRGLRRAQPELPELRRRPRLLRRPAADRPAARRARRGRRPQAAVPQAQADAGRRRAARDRRHRRRASRSSPASRSTCPRASPRRSSCARRRASGWRRCPARSAARRSRRSSTTSSRTLHGIAGDRYALMAAGGVASAEGAYRKLAARRLARAALHGARLPRAARGHGDPARARGAARARRARDGGGRRRQRRAVAVLLRRVPRDRGRPPVRAAGARARRALRGLLLAHRAPGARARRRRHRRRLPRLGDGDAGGAPRRGWCGPPRPATAVADPHAFGMTVGGALRGDALGVHADLGPDARLDVALHDVVRWPRRGARRARGSPTRVPGLPQYWQPVVLHARGARPRADRRRE